MLFTISDNTLQVSAKPAGAELTSLQYRHQELLWQADPHVWPRHAPVLFPIVGKLKNNTLIHKGKPCSMGQHGFARDMDFECVEHTDHRMCFELIDNEQTRAMFPFAFDLTIAYTIYHGRLDIDYAIRNNHDVILPCSIGGHPAFNWPLESSKSKDEYFLEFESNEPGGVQRLQQGLLENEIHNTPVVDKRMPLRDEMFEDDAIIFRELSSRSVTYRAQQGLALRVSFEDYPHLGIWTKPGARFVCIEPWQGYASPVDFEGEFIEKPGIVKIPPYSERTWRYSIEVFEI